ncbi:hypothetical protein NWP17_15845 [Chrysosporum bergii ANA360D]|uniref:Uncharacterized protein n=1 Tax=Chrysosporum bergii ANA360D TaxID=617107 RepID=A0AA43KDF7_9CYAN|nr:hypothetical protein [Chrysosporum bergii]MDH6061888.1 hypothetical protein [Chrysosporum bergii ANA360D]
MSVSFFRFLYFTIRTILYKIFICWSNQVTNTVVKLSLLVMYKPDLAGKKLLKPIFVRRSPDFYSQIHD